MTQAIPITGPLAASPRAGALAAYGDTPTASPRADAVVAYGGTPAACTLLVGAYDGTPSGSPLLVGVGLGVRYA